MLGFGEPDYSKEETMRSIKKLDFTKVSKECAINKGCIMSSYTAPLYIPYVGMHMHGCLMITSVSIACMLTSNGCSLSGSTCARYPYVRPLQTRL